MDNTDNNDTLAADSDLVFNLKYSTVTISLSSRSVTTSFSCGHFSTATRPCTTENEREARSEGYEGNDPAILVWRSLVEHELLHSLVAEVLFDRPSCVLETEAGVHVHPLWERYEEEMLVLSYQYLLNTEQLTDQLKRFWEARDGVWDVYDRWQSEYKNSLEWQILG
jgi:hypothetical protein